MGISGPFLEAGREIDLVGTPELSGGIESGSKVLEKQLLIINPYTAMKVMYLMYNLVFKFRLTSNGPVRYLSMNRVAKTTYFLAFFNGLKRLNTKRIVGFTLFLFCFLVQHQALAFYADSSKMGQIKTVVIDAGHGGHDPGCLGSSAREKVVCLSVALKLGKLIENYFPDVKVVYTRDSDVFVKLHERAQIANDHKADLFISIHANSAGNRAAKGTETFVMGTKYVDRNLNVTKRENAVILLEDDYQNKYDGYDPNSPIMNIIGGLYQQEYLEQSINLANKVEHQFVMRNKRSSRGVKQRVLLVMYRTAMPSVLIEVGFLTNAEEHNLLNKDKGQKETAGAIFRAFLEYKREMEGGTPFEIATEEKKVFDNWEKIYAGDSALITKIRPVLVHKHQEIKVEVPDSTVLPDLLIKVQITSSSKKIELNSRKFKGLPDVWEYKSGTMYKYTSGNFTDFESALKAQKEIKATGFKDAFVVSFYKGVRISNKLAQEKLKTQ